MSYASLVLVRVPEGCTVYNAAIGIFRREKRVPGSKHFREVAIVDGRNVACFVYVS